MPTNHPAPRDQRALRITVAMLVVLAVAGVLGLVAEITSADALQRKGSGTLIIEGNPYEFTPVTCFVSDDQFIAAGTGRTAGQQYWVSVSNANLDLSVGTEHPNEQPADDQLWLVSNELIDWTSVGHTVVARASMFDRRSPNSEPVLGALELRCDDAGI